MIETCIKQSLGGRTSPLVDKRDVALHVGFNWCDVDEVFQAAVEIYEQLTLPFKEGFVMDLGVSQRTVSMESVLDRFCKSMKRGYGSFYYDGMQRGL